MAVHEIIGLLGLSLGVLFGVRVMTSPDSAGVISALAGGWSNILNAVGGTAPAQRAA